MIIKIKQGGVDQVSWRFHDNVHEVGYATVERHEVPSPLLGQLFGNVGVQFEGDDDIVREIHFIGAAIPETCLCITFINFNGKPHEVYTDATVYLLNDHGKTIERIS